MVDYRLPGIEEEEEDEDDLKKKKLLQEETRLACDVLAHQL